MPLNPDDPLENFALTPINYFDVEFSVGRGWTLLPDLAELTREQPCADLEMRCEDTGVHFRVRSLPGEKIDSVELYLDTRDLKSVGFNHKFCHHFICRTEALEGSLIEEITHFRTEDRHDLCDPALLQCETKKEGRSQRMEIFIPREALTGYDPKQFDRLGFSYRILAADGQYQHFALATDEFQVDQNPSLWASAKIGR